MNTIHSEEKTTISHYLNDGSCTLYVEYDYKISIHSLSNELSVALFKITLHIFAYDWHPFIQSLFKVIKASEHSSIEQWIDQLKLMYFYLVNKSPQFISYSLQFYIFKADICIYSSISPSVFEPRKVIL